MTNTKNTTFSIRLKCTTKKRLAQLAQRSGRSANFLVADAVESYLGDQERLHSDLRLADRQLPSGHYIRNEDMKAWLLSWGTKHELPAPKCVCGKTHNDTP
jgi:predicted transcriptional regulator